MIIYIYIQINRFVKTFATDIFRSDTEITLLRNLITGVTPRIHLLQQIVKQFVP